MILFTWRAPSHWRGGRTEEKEKSRMTVKIFPYRLHRNPCGFLLSCGIRKTSLRQRLHSTATLFDWFQCIRNRRSSQDSRRKKCSCWRKKRTAKGLGTEIWENSKHSKCMYTCRKTVLRAACRSAIFLFWDSPKPSASIYIGAILSAKIITLLAYGSGINYNRVDEQRRNCNR